ncbi:MAG: phosphate/phosphite/phosphonate ABC transporter substrate-binding protein [Desulfobacteraceae bacterium]|nr:phosphate/phosphite/phosphonate ABC transporter substrate-binding protein [Desulfobacteraceae bacterium]
MFRIIFSTCMVMVLSIGLSGCEKREEKKIILGQTGTALEKPQEEAKVRIAVGGMITPKEGVVYYRDLLRYIQDKIGEKIEYVDRESYAEINEMLRTGKLEAAFVCSGPYVDGQKQFGLELLVAPQAYGETVYYSYILVAQDSAIRSFEELRGKRFAFTDPLSNTGKLVPTYMLAKINETPERFFKEVIFSKSHDKSIKAVAQGIVEGAAVDSLVWEYLNATNPEFTSKTRILKKSSPYAIPPVAVPRNLTPDLKDKMKQAFLHAHLDPQGQEILQKMKIDKFVEIADQAYDSVREMKDWIEQRKAGE